MILGVICNYKYQLKSFQEFRNEYIFILLKQRKFFLKFIINNLQIQY